MQNTSEGNFNGDYFIQMNKLYSEFNVSIESLSNYVVTFWQIFEKTILDVQATHICGKNIAKTIQNVFKIFKELDTLKLTKDYQMYFQFAII